MKKQLLAFSTLAIGALIGASALSALAAGSWTPPTTTPPGNNADAPINVGNAAAPALQTRNAPLQINGNLGIVGNLIVATGTPPLAGKVLTAMDNLGTVGWVNLPSAASVSHGIQAYTTPGSFNWTVPSGVSTVKVKVWGAGGGGIGYGGGGGAFSESVISVSAGTVYHLTVGSGTAGPGGSSQFNPTGGSFVSGSPTIIAGGGAQGNGGSTNVGGTASGGMLNLPGGHGGGVSSEGGASPMGGAGGIGGGGVLAGQNGQFPGGGGAGSGGSQGADGMVLFEY